MGGVGTLVGPALHLARSDVALGGEPGNDVEADGVAHSVGHEGLLTCTVQTDAAAAHLGGAPGAQGLVEGVLFVAEAAADIGLDDLHVSPGAAQGLANHPADDVGDLGGGDHHNPSVFLIGEAAVVLDVTVLHRGGVVPALHLDEARLPDGSLIVALSDVGVLEHVAGEALVELWSAGFHGLLGVQHEGQLIIFHL